MKQSTVCACAVNDIVPPDYKIKPSDIEFDMLKFLANFGSNDTAMSAFNIIKFCRQKENNRWRPFTKKEIDNFLGEEFWSNRLVGKNLLIFKKRRYYVTKEFIKKCYSAQKEPP